MVSGQVCTLATLSGTSRQGRVDAGLLFTGPRPSAFFSQDAVAGAKKVP